MCQELLVEARYYQLEPLVAILQDAVTSAPTPASPMSPQLAANHVPSQCMLPGSCLCRKLLQAHLKEQKNTSQKKKQVVQSLSLPSLRVHDTDERSEGETGEDGEEGQGQCTDCDCGGTTDGKALLGERLVDSDDQLEDIEGLALSPRNCSGCESPTSSCTKHRKARRVVELDAITLPQARDTRPHREMLRSVSKSETAKGAVSVGRHEERIPTPREQAGEEEDTSMLDQFWPTKAEAEALLRPPSPVALPTPPPVQKRVEVKKVRPTQVCGRRAYAEYTWAEIRKHNRIDDCWLVVRGSVYNVTEAIPKHPAGAKAILRHGGTDATEDYDFHSTEAQKLWGPYKIGTVEGSSKCSIM